ncbi:uncharacterized protein LOC118481047 [Helianthus annuus]|uniref:uncharacterized protein LOC118481047 n=1 Tax=Helianthus annuus TaxID=4232 RepID=UPI0016531A2A|nr:uncharacterized protein LOC118481047 [Helianthus annuus]
MDNQDFFNMFAGIGAAIQSPASIVQNVNMENELGTMQKPPKLMSLDEYAGWSGRFKNWVQANHFECWMKIEKKYVPPVDGLGMVKDIGSLTDTEQTEFKAEKKMVSILQQAIKEDILVLLQHDESSQSICSDFVNLNLSAFIEKIEAHELELLKIKKMNSTSMQQDVSLYYKGSPSVANLQSPKIQTGFSADNTSNATSSSHQSISSTPFANFEPNVNVQEQSSPQSSTGSNHQAYVSGVQCNIAVNIKNGNEITETAAKQHIALLASVLEAYEGLVAGRIGNPDMTKEDYDQIDPEELELIDIKWGMASLVRRAQRFVEITGRNSLSGPDQKLGFDKSKVTCFKCKERSHFKRECPNREVNNHQNPFTNDYYRQAIYHRPNQHRTVQRPQIENKPEKALIVNQDDEQRLLRFEVVTEPEIVDEVVSEVVEEIPTENVIDVEEIAAEVYYYQSQQEELAYTMKSIMPPNVFDSFAGYFEEPRTGSCPRFEEKKEAIEEVIDVSKEMTGEVLKDIADKALMGNLKEVDSEPKESQSIDKVSVNREESGVQEVKSVKQSVSESKHVGKTGCDEKIDEKVVPISETPCQRCLQPCVECLEKDTKYRELKHHTDMIKFDLEQLKEAYDTLARSIKMIQKESFENDKATKLAKATLFDKQKEVNYHLDTITSLRKELELAKIENDRIDKKLMSYVLDEESEKSEKAHSEKAVSDSENEGNFLDRYVPKSEKSTNDDPIMVVYTMVGTEKLYSDFEYPLQNVKIENVEKVFKLVELNINEINNNEFFSKLKKSFFTSRPISSEKKDGVGKAQKLKEETVNTTFVEYDKRVCYRCNEIGHMAKQCQKVFKKHVVEKPNVQKQNVQKQMVKKSRPKSPVVSKVKKEMVSPIRILKRVWIVKLKPSVEIKKMENALKNDSNLFKDDVVDFENEVDKFLDEFPPITNKVKIIVKEEVPNVTFDFPKTNEKCDVVFGNVSEVKKSWVSLFE